MSDLPEPQTHLAVQESIASLQDTFTCLLECATESADRETGLVAAVMTDLLTSARVLLDDPSSGPLASEIAAYCRDDVLPTIADMNTEQLKQLHCQVGERWAECLSLLSPDESIVFQHSSRWDTTDEQTQPAFQDTSDSLPDDIDHGEFSSIPSDLNDILATLADDVDEPAADHGPPEPSVAVSESDAVEDPELIAAFVDDAQQCLTEMESSLLSLEQLPADEHATPLRNFCRQLHTLKGASGTVGLTQLAGDLHQLESYIETSATDRVDVDRLLEGIDAVHVQLGLLGSSGSSSSGPTALGCGKEDRAPDKPAPQLPPSVATTDSDGELFVRVEASRLERLMDLLAELVMLRNRRDTCVDSLREIHGELNHCAARTRTMTSTAEQCEAGSGRQAARLKLLTRELDEVSSDTAELSHSLRDVFEPLSEDNSSVSHLIGRFRQELMELRRLPVSGLFQRLQRAVRDAARAEGKQVRIQFEGQGARADRTVQERLFEPLLHLVRNAVSHGIQSEESRRRAGKPGEGRITLTARSDANSLSVEVRDDGEGLDEAALETRGRQLGLLTAGRRIDRDQLWKLIFHPGFSTKADVSQISGRGVGMDVVDSWVRRLRGSISVESTAGQGTVFRLQVPLRSSVEHAMVIRSGGQLFAVPMHAVSETSDARIHTSGPWQSDDTETLTVSLSQLLGCGNAAPRCFVTLHPSPTSAQGSGNRVTIAVDAIVGVEEVVVRSLPPLLQRNELFAGVTLSGRAETVLLLDADRLMTLSQESGRVPANAADNALPHHRSDSLSGPAGGCILVVDDSVTVRRSLSKKLSASGLSVREACNGREALDAIRLGDVAAVVTDIDMPVMSGIELLEEMKHHQDLSAIPVAVLTSREGDFLPSWMACLQPAAVLEKPVTDETVASVIEAFSGALDSHVI